MFVDNAACGTRSVVYRRREHSTFVDGLYWKIVVVQMLFASMANQHEYSAHSLPVFSVREQRRRFGHPCWTGDAFYAVNSSRVRGYCESPTANTAPDTGPKMMNRQHKPWIRVVRTDP